MKTIGILQTDKYSDIDLTLELPFDGARPMYCRFIRFSHAGYMTDPTKPVHLRIYTSSIEHVREVFLTEELYNELLKDTTHDHTVLNIDDKLYNLLRSADEISVTMGLLLLQKKLDPIKHKQLIKCIKSYEKEL